MAKIEIDCCENESSIKITLKNPNNCGDTEEKYPIFNEKSGRNYIITIANCLTENERKGFLAEQKFAKYLDDNKIPYLYIGQLASSLSYSQILKDSGVRRPDFLICHPDFGNILIDVKARKRYYGKFNINREEYLGLCGAQGNIKIPVWLAFADAEQLQEDKTTEFFFISTEKINRYIENITYITRCQNDIINISDLIMMNEKEFYSSDKETQIDEEASALL